MTTETTFEQIVEIFGGDRELVDKIAGSMGIQESDCFNEEHYMKKIEFSYQSGEGVYCPVTNTFITPKLLWQAALEVHKH